jgi:hypothetical protein
MYVAKKYIYAQPMSAVRRNLLPVLLVTHGYGTIAPEWLRRLSRKCLDFAGSERGYTMFDYVLLAYTYFLGSIVWVLVSVMRKRGKEEREREKND